MGDKTGTVLAVIGFCPEPIVFYVRLGIRIRPYDCNPLALSVCEKHIDLKRKFLASLLFKHFFDFFLN